MKNNELAHYGVLGMKWGHRKQKYYEKKARTSTGKKAEKYINKLEKQKRINKKANKEYRRKILSDPTKLYKHRNEFSKEEINSAMKRFETEEKLRSHSANRKNSRLNTLNRVIGYGTAAFTVYEMAKKGKKIVNDILEKNRYKQMSIFDYDT